MSVSVSFTFNNGTIVCKNPSVSASKGDQMEFSITNNSPEPTNASNTIADWGLYFNNPFSLENEQKYSFGAGTPGTLTVETDHGNQQVPAYNSYLTYVQTQDGVFHLLDPVVIVLGGDTGD